MSNRSGSPYSAPTDADRRPVALGASSSDGITPLPLEINPATGRLLVDSTGGGAGTQYTQGGATVANPTGTAEIWFDGSGNPKSVTPSQPLPSNITNGTNIADVVAGDTGFNGVATASASKTYSFTTSASGAQTILPNTPLEGFTWIEIVYTSVGVGLALTGQFSPTSGGTYVNSTTFANGSGAAVAGLGLIVNNIYSGPIRGNFFQIAVSALTSGTFSGNVTLRATPPPIPTISVDQSGTWTVGSNSATGSAVPANAFYIAGLNASGNLTGFQTQSTAVDAESGNSALAVGSVLYNGSSYDRKRSGGVLGMQGVSLQASPSGGWTYQNITSATTTTVKSGSGTVHAINFNTLVASATVTVYDNTAASGTKIGTFTIPSTITGVDPFSIPLDAAFATGLTIVTSGATDLTVLYK